MAEVDPIEEAMDAIALELKEGLGERCERFEMGCLSCAAWRSYDELSNALFQIWEAKQLTT